MKMDWMKEAQKLQSQLSRWYQDLHQIPEIGLDLPETSAYLQRELEAMGYQPQVLGSSGICVQLTGSQTGGVLLLRADMDALPMEEMNELPFRSRRKNAAHMCGHDSHMAMLLGAAKLLAEHRSQVAGTIKFLFQPGEEGFNGALEMIQAGVLEQPAVEAAMAFHCLCGDHHPSGTVLCALDGPAKASADAITIRVLGKGCHGATPEQGVDVLNILCRIHSSLQTILEREISPFEQAVLSLCQIHAGTASNILPSEGFMEGTLRTFSEETRSRIKQRVREIAESTAALFGGRCEVTFHDGLQATLNDRKLAAEMFSYVCDLLDEGQAGIIGPVMGAEDFSEISARVPSVYMDLACGSVEEGYCYGVHSPHFRLNQEALPTGTACFVQCALKYLEARQH